MVTCLRLTTCQGARNPDTHALRVLANVEEIAISYLSEADVIRHNLVKKIIAEYKKYEERQNEE